MAEDQLIAELSAMTAERDRLRAALHELVEAGDMISTGTSTDRDHYARYERAADAARAALAVTAAGGVRACLLSSETATTVSPAGGPNSGLPLDERDVEACGDSLRPAGSGRSELSAPVKVPSESVGERSPWAESVKQEAAQETGNPRPSGRGAGQDIATLKQAISEIYHCVEAGPSWFTKGERGQMDHARMWTDRATKAISRLTAEHDRLRAALEAINRLASPSPYRTFDECSADLNWCANEARRALAPTPPPPR